MARNDWLFNGRLPQNTVFSFASASFKFNYHQEQADNGGITIIIIITRDEQGGDGLQWPHGDIFCSLFSYSLLYIYIERESIYTHVDWQDNGPGSCGGAEGA